MGLLLECEPIILWRKNLGGEGRHLGDWVKTALKSQEILGVVTRGQGGRIVPRTNHYGPSKGLTRNVQWVQGEKGRPLVKRGLKGELTVTGQDVQRLSGLGIIPT